MLPNSPRLRRLLLAYAINELGTWFGYVALAVGVYDHTHSAIATAGLFVSRGLLPALLAPVLVTRVESSRRRGRLASLYLVEGALAVALALLLWRFWLPGVLILVAVDAIVAVAATALIRAWAARIEPHAPAGAEPAIATAAATAASPERNQRQASAALNLAFMTALGIGPAIGGVLVHAVGGPVTLLIDALTFLLSGGLLMGVQIEIEEAGEGSLRARMTAAWRHIQALPQLRTLLLTEAIAVIFFSSVESVEVLYVKATLSAGNIGYGLLVGTWGGGAALGAILFARSVHRRLGPMLTGGTLLVGLAYLGYAAAPTLPIACLAAIIGGVGNGIQWPALISAVQQLTPPHLHGRLMSAVGSLNALCPAIGFSLGGTIAALSSPRGAMVVAGAVATLATIAFLRRSIHGLPLADQSDAAVSTGAGIAAP